MELVKKVWSSKDIEEFQHFLLSKINKDKVLWTKNIIRTNLPVLAIKTPELKNIAKQIAKGNYVSFLSFMVWEYYENSIINGVLISKIKDFNVMKSFLDIYSSKVDNWASCDMLSFNIKNNETKYLSLVEEYIKSPHPFVRRIGMRILFKFIADDKYFNKIYEYLDLFFDEQEYYVNMMNAWLLCECMIKRKKETLEYLKQHKLNKFTINKAISKCRDSYRISAIDKDLLLKYKR